MPEPLLSIPDVAVLLNVDQSTVRRLIYRHALRAVRIGKLWRVRPEDVERLMTPAPEKRAELSPGVPYVAGPVVAAASEPEAALGVPLLKFLKKRVWETGGAAQREAASGD